MTTPYQGNDSFRRVENIAEQIDQLSLGDLKVANAQVDGGLHAGESLASAAIARVPADKTLMVATLYTSGTTWHTAGTAAALVTTSGGSTNFTFSAAASVVAAVVNPTEAFNGAVGALVNLGVAAAATTVNNGLIDSTAFANLGTVGEHLSVSNGAGSSLGTDGVAPSVSASAGNFVTISAETANLSAGQAEVKVYYYLN